MDDISTEFRAAVAAGTVLDLDGKSIDADVIRRACIDRDAIVDPRGIRLARAVVAGTLDLTGADIGFPLRFDECSFEQAPILHGARVKEFVLTGCPDLPGLLANGVAVQGDLDLSRTSITGRHATTASTSRQAAVWLCESDIGGRLLCLDTTIDAGGERAIQADRMRVGGTVRFLHNFHAKGELRLVGVDVRGSFDLTGAHVESDSVAVDLSDATIGGNLFIVRSLGGRSPVLRGRIDLSSTRIDAQLLIRDAVIHRPEASEDSHYSRARFRGRAVTGQRLYVGAELAIEGDTSIVGGVDLPSADLGGFLVEPGGELSAPGQVVVNLTNAEVRSDVTVGDGVHVRGTVLLLGTRVRGRLHLNGVVLSEPAGRSLLKADGASIDGHVELRGLRASGGQLKFWRTTFGGGVDASRAVLENPTGSTLRLHQSSVRGTVQLGHGFQSTGCVVLNRSVVEGTLDLAGAVLTCPAPGDHNPEGSAIQAISATFRGGMDLTRTQISPAINLTDAVTTVLRDEPDTWPERIHISGFTYDRFAHTTWDWRQRLGWLRRQVEYDAGPFEQASRVFRQHGYLHGAEELLIAQRTHARRADASSRWLPRRGINALYGATVGYGFRPSRVLWLLAILLVLVSASLTIPAFQATLRTSDEGVVFTTTGTLITAEGERPALHDPCGDGRVHCFNPVLYAIDTVVPLIALDQRSTWYPNHFEPWGSVVEWWLNLAAVAGWTLSSIFLLSLARLARSI